MKFVDMALAAPGADNANNVIAIMNQVDADDFAYYVGGNIALHPWNIMTASESRTATRHGMGIWVSTVNGRDGTIDGTQFVNELARYGARLGDRACWDLEP